jgi:hypothetical protein
MGYLVHHLIEAAAAVRPEATAVIVTVTREYDEETKTDTFELDRSTLQALASGHDPAPNVFDEIEDDDVPPVFEATQDLETIRISIEPKDPETVEFTGDSLTIQFDDRFSVISMPDLTVGFIEIGDPDGGENFGGTTGRIKDSISDLADASEEFYHRTYPVAEVSASVHPLALIDDDAVSTEPGRIPEDLKSARAALENEFPEVDFDVTVAFVPEDYPSFHKDGFSGRHYGNIDGAAAVRGDLRLDKTDGFFEQVSAHEVGHHFLGDVYPDKLAMRGDGGTPDNAHARTERSKKDKTFLDSTGFDLRNGTYNVVGTRLESFMSYNGDDFPSWVDAHAYDAMLDNRLATHPQPVAASSDATEQPILDGIGRFADDDTTIFTRIFTKAGVPKQSVDGAAVTVTVLDGTENPIDERSFPDELEFHRFEDPERSRGTEADVFSFAVPFPEEAAAIEAERNGTVTRLNPIERSLREAIARLPDAAFRRATKGRRNALNNKLDELDEKMAAGEYQEAVNKLEHDIRDKLEKWIHDEYETSALQPTKTELLALVDEMIARLETLVGASSS